MLVSSTALAQGLTTQSPASAQPTLPRAMPNLTVPVAPTGEARSKPARHAVASRHRHHYARRGRSEPVERPALANVELLEPLPYPPQPPHVAVPVPAYPFEDAVLGLITPPPPVVCRPTRRDPYKPDLHPAAERPVLCTADNP